MTNLLYPDVIDASTLGARYSTGVFLAMGVEGQGGTDGNAVVGMEYKINRPSDATTYFGATSPLSQLIQFLLSQGVAPIYGIASVKGATPPTLAQRQAAWSILEADPNIRIRMVDATDQATFQALGTSCDNAALLQNKQIAFCGLPAGTSKATVISTSEAINHRRVVLVAPGVIDTNGLVWSGVYAAALVAAQVALNSDISNDLNLQLIPNFVGIENNALGQPLFMERVVSGVVVNDFEDVLQAGGSPLMTDRYGGGLRVAHLRMTYTGSPPESDYTYDALMTRLIVDQIFVLVRQFCYANNFLDMGNTPNTQGMLASGIVSLLTSLSDWVSPITQADGTPGYAVSVIPTPDMRNVIIQYQGIVVRGITQIQLDGQLTIQV